MLPSLSTATPTGSLNCPSRVPTTPNWPRNLPLRSNFWTRLLPVSETSRLPSLSMRNGARAVEDAGLAVGNALRVDQTAAPLGHELAVLVELLDAVVPGVGNVDVAVLVHRHAPRLVELAVALTLRAEGHQELAAGVELLDAMVERVGDIDVALACQRRRSWDRRTGRCRRRAARRSVATAANGLRCTLIARLSRRSALRTWSPPGRPTRS